MARAGAEILFDCKEFSLVGIFSILTQIRFLFRVRKRLLSEILSRQPEAVLLVDYGGFNLALAKIIKAKYESLPILYFISPQVWGSRPWRINTIAQTVDKMLVIFPFEEQVYATRGVDAEFVGHPLVNNLPEIEHLLTREEFCLRYELNVEHPIIGIFPGSRRGEVKALLPVTLQAINWLHRLRPDLQFVISAANKELGQGIENTVKKNITGSPDLSKVLRVASDKDTYSLMSVGDLQWTKSGTTTLEATLYGKPMIVYYRADWLSYLLFLAFKRVKRVSWPNLLAGKTLVPELIQLDCRAEMLVKYTIDLLDVPQLRKEIESELLSFRKLLGQGNYARKCAEAIIERCKAKKSQSC
jgi:lipid-A-disaccharide synthase